jgi:hypothetical protein
MAVDGKSAAGQKQDGWYDWGKMWAKGARTNLSVDSNVLTHRTMGSLWGITNPRGGLPVGSR